MRKQGPLKMELVDPRKLNPSAYNQRKISAHAMKLLCSSIAKFGFIDPIQVQGDGDNIIGGNQRVKAAIQSGLGSIPIVRLDLAEKDAKLLNLALNAEYGAVDVPKLSFLLKELKLGGACMELSGYDAQRIEELTSDTAAVLEEIDLRAPPAVVWILLGIPSGAFGEARESLAALQELSAVSVQSNRD